MSEQNETGEEITDINIIGCNTGNIDNLKVGESETIWVSIIDDCFISLVYLSEELRNEKNGCRLR
jgi:hypothetical protein